MEMERPKMWRQKCVMVGIGMSGTTSPNHSFVLCTMRWAGFNPFHARRARA
ncbi:hypothetical protein GBA52_002675 [Prunus armeniaca]|nr:hypothetical protein GBA52_002675 [Prunus armeniaca]